MRFAFLVHPISDETDQLLELASAPEVRERWGQDLFGAFMLLHKALRGARRTECRESCGQIRLLDAMTNLVSDSGAMTEGRLYQIPMNAFQILDEPSKAMEYMVEAADQATEWGAGVIGLGSITAVIGGQGAELAERSSTAVTTGNSLTVYAALEMLRHICRETDEDLSRETVVVVGAPGSIASATARMLAPNCGSLLLVARRPSTRVTRLAEELDAELLFDIPEALRRARLIVTATSSGNCIDQGWLRPGSVVVDVAVPTDVRGTQCVRDDVLILSGGLTRIPRDMSRNSTYLWLNQGVVPSCLAETMVLGLENRAECFSLGRRLPRRRIEEIGSLAREHGFDFSGLFSFGLPLDDGRLVKYRKATLAVRTQGGHNGSPRRRQPPSAEELAPRAAELFGRYINPALMGVCGESGFVKTFVRGEGTHLQDETGNWFLDFVAGFGSLNLGHNHPEVVKAIRLALQRQAPGFAQSAVNPYGAALAERLVTLAPPSLETVFFANSGTEAVEAALKLARICTGRTGLLYCERSYHGKTLGALSVTGNSQYRQPFGPLLGDCLAVPFGDLPALEQALATRRFAALVVEPLQAEGGMYLPPDDYLYEAQRLCRQNGTLLAVDEVQTGMGRLGTLFACEQLGVEPDLMMLAKSLGGGLLPIGAMLARRDLTMKAYGTVQTLALHSSTFGGGSLACAAGLATLDVLQDHGLLANVQARGNELHQGLNDVCRRHHSVIREVRGQGLLLGLEFEPARPAILAHWKGTENGRQLPFMIPNFDAILESGPTLYAMQTLLETHQIYTQVTRSNPRVLRVQPSLIVSDSEISRFLSAIEDCCREIESCVYMFDGVVAKSSQGAGNYARGPTAPVKLNTHPPGGPS